MFDQLVLLLRSEDARVAAHAAWAIAKACHGHFANKQVVGGTQEVFEGLVELLGSCSPLTATHAAGALATLCGGGHSPNQEAAAQVRESLAVSRRLLFATHEQPPRCRNS